MQVLYYKENFDYRIKLMFNYSRRSLIRTKIIRIPYFFSLGSFIDRKSTENTNI